MTNQKTTAVLAVALLAGSNAFMAPGVSSAHSAQSRTVMSAQKPSNSAKATAAALLAGIVSAGAAFTSPVDAAMFDVAAPEQTMQTNVGFGMPEPSSDPTNNNAASGKTNGAKYDIKQQGEFAKQNTGDGKGIDYGSAKGTDFGATAGGNSGVATNKKATDGDFLADAKQNTREGVQIAEKNTKDAANVEWGRDVSKQTRGAGTIADGIEKAKSIATGGATDGLSTASNKASEAADNAGKAINNVKNNPSRWGQKWQAASNTGKPNTAKPTGNTLNNGFTSSLKDAVSSVQDALPNANDVNVPSNVKDAGRQVKNKVQSGINTAKSATSDLRDPNVDASIQTPKVGGFFGVNSREQAQQVAQKTSDKVKSDINSVQNAAPNSASDAGNAIKNKVSGDVQTAKRAVNDATPNSNELQNAASAAKSKVNSDVNGVKGALNNAVGDAVEKGSPASTLLSVEGGFFGANSKEQADLVGQKTVNKVKDDIATARANPPFQGDTGNVDASGAAKAVKGKVNSDINATKKQWQYATSKVSNSNPAQAAKGKVNSDVNAVKSWGSSAGNAVARNAPKIDTPEVGGFFGTQPKQQADTINAKTAQKVKSDINAVKGGIPSTGSDLKNAAASLGNKLSNN